MNLELYIITVKFNDAQFYHQRVEGIQHDEQYNKNMHFPQWWSLSKVHIFFGKADNKRHKSFR